MKLTERQDSRVRLLVCQSHGPDHRFFNFNKPQSDRINESGQGQRRDLSLVLTRPAQSEAC